MSINIFKNMGIRQLIRMWGIVTIMAIVIMAAVSIYSNELYYSAQEELTYHILPLEDSSRDISSIAATFITRQKQIIVSSSWQDLENVKSRDTLERQFKHRFDSLSSSVSNIEGGAYLVVSLQNFYQHFLQNDDELLRRIRQRYAYKDQLDSRTEEMQAAEQNIQQVSLLINEKIHDYTTSTSQQQIPLHSNDELVHVQYLNQQLTINMLSLFNLINKIMLTDQIEHLNKMVEVDFPPLIGMLNGTINDLEGQLSADLSLMGLLVSLKQTKENLIKLVKSGHDSVIELHHQKLANEGYLVTLQQQAISLLDAIGTKLDSISELVNEQSKYKVKQTSDITLTARWATLLLSLSMVVSIIWFVRCLSLSIGPPLAEIRAAMSALSLEKFDTRLPVRKGRNEFSLLAKDFNLFASNTQRLIEALAEAKNSIQVREQHISAIFNSVPDAILTLAADGTIMAGNPAAEKMFKASSEQLKDLNFLQFLAVQHQASNLVDIKNLQQTSGHEFEGFDYNGAAFSMCLSLSPIINLDGDLWVGVIGDMSGWKATEAKLKQTSSELNAILENAMVGIAFVKNRNLIRVNHKFEELFGYERKDIEGYSTVALFPSAEVFEQFGDRAYQILSGGNNFEEQLELIRQNGDKFWCAVSGKVIDLDKPSEGSIWLYEDITTQHENEERLIKLASTDTLTGLPNRTVFNDRLEHAIHKCHRNSERLAVFFIDLDHFKHINDSLGHKAGDLLLAEVGHRVKSCTREVDTVARLGGDEFTLILEEVRSAQYVGKVAEKILFAVTQPFNIDSTDVNVSPSIGISLYPADGRDADMLIRNADAAMYHAKKRGRNNFQFYSAEMNAEAAQQLAIETGLRRAVKQQELSLHYQPQIDLDSGKISGAEVLLRWHSEQWGDVPPIRFVSILEDTGLIGIVGERVLRQACETFMALRDQLPADFVMAVNLSGRQFTGGTLVTYIRDLLAETGMPATNLELEITESILMENTEGAINALCELSALGITLAIDDFGTGYSSLSYLKQFPLNVLKVDRSFVRDVTEDKDDAAIVDAIMAMSSSLQLKVVAEGVETEAQLAFLKSHNCQCAQGYFFSKPLPLDKLITFVNEGRTFT